MNQSKKYKNRYRIASARAQWWDYGRNAAYFITICTAHRKAYFGQIKNGKMQLSPVGVLADVFWHEIKHHAKGVELDAFVVMPNHIHGILILNDGVDDPGIKNPAANDRGIADHPAEVLSRQSRQSRQSGQSGQSGQSRQSGQSGQSRQSRQSGQSGQSEKSGQPGQKRFQNPGKNTISSIIGSYKSAVTKHARRLGYQFAWQPRFYDHIIRDDASFHRIANYIEKNVENWTSDKFN